MNADIYEYSLSSTAALTKLPCLFYFHCGPNKVPSVEIFLFSCLGNLLITNNYNTNSNDDDDDDNVNRKNKKSDLSHTIDALQNPHQNDLKL